MKTVEVIISNQTKPVSQKGFGLPLVFIPDLEVAYAEVTGTDGLPVAITTDSLAYKQVQTAFAQNPAPSKIAVAGEDISSGKTAPGWAAATVYSVGDLIKPLAENGHYYKCTVGGTSSGSEPAWSTTENAEITDGSVTWKETGYTSISAALDGLVVEHNDFYFLLVASRVSADIIEASNWTSSKIKFFVGQNDISLSVSEIIALRDQMISDRAALYAHDGAGTGNDPAIDAAIVGRQAPKLPGSTTWDLQFLNLVSVAGYKNAELSQLEAGKINSYVKEFGVNATSDGFTTGGSYIDITRSSDWIQSKMSEEVFFQLYNSEKIPYTDGGITKIVLVMEKVLKAATRQGIIAKDEIGNAMYKI
ncbi:MAG: DUF3383 family protein, partial [Desulfobacterales bacterium]|nr:DUF3383 family protein [Desulfobacterales bacterium]